MKRPVFLIIGTVLVFILLIVWLYVLFFGTPNNRPESYTDLGFENQEIIELAEDESVILDSVVDVSSPERLRQLTTKKVAGYQYIDTGTSTPDFVYYVEAGTGHTFSIDMNSGAEERLSGTTVAGAKRAYITPNGSYILIQSGNLGPLRTQIGTIESGVDRLTLTDMTDQIDTIGVTNYNTFLYTTKTNNSTIGKEYDPRTGTIETIFTIPFREVTVRFASRASDIHVAYPKSSAKLMGYVYLIDNGIMRRSLFEGAGIGAAGTGNNLLISQMIDGVYTTQLNSNDTVDEIPVTIIPEKCTVSDRENSIMFCASDFNEGKFQGAPDNWFKGLTVFDDNLWQINVETKNARLEFLGSDTGRQIDIIDIRTDVDSENLLFTNRSDQTLWLYEIIPALLQQ